MPRCALWLAMASCCYAITVLCNDALLCNSDQPNCFGFILPASFPPIP
jgi:hypothetical protein